MNRMAADILIGDLLRNAKIVSLADLTHAIQVSARIGLPVGRVLVMLELVSKDVVQAALEAQSLVRDRLVTLDVAVRALQVVASRRVSFEQALKLLGDLPPKSTPSNKLGELLVTAELISPAQLNDALQTSQHLNLPLGRILVLKSILLQRQVEAALEVQVLLRDEKITRTEALEVLRSMRLSGAGVEACLANLGCGRVERRHTVRLGELFVLAELVCESDLLTALELGLLKAQPIGQVLLSFGFIDEMLLEAALNLQAMITNGHLTAPQAARALNMVSTQESTLAQAVAEVAEPLISHIEIFGLLELLHLAGLLTEEDCQTLVKFRECAPIDRVLLTATSINETTLHVAIRCQLLLSQGLLTEEQAVVALHIWRWSGVTLGDILRQMGWMYPHSTYYASAKEKSKVSAQAQEDLLDSLVPPKPVQPVPHLKQTQTVINHPMEMQVHHSWH